VFYKTATHEERREGFLEPQEWTGYEVYDPLGQKIGQAEEIHVNASDDPEYIRVRMGFLRPKTVLIPVHLAAADAERRVIELR
jgi:PRC-barrel domain